MMKAIIVHRWDGSHSSDWYPWLKKELEKNNVSVEVPAMPNAAEPKINAWVSQLKRSIGITDDELVLIGHSIGCQTIMRYLAESPSVNVKRVIFVAGWFALENLENEEVKAIAKPWLTEPIGFKKIKEKTRNITVFLSTNDPYGCVKENKRLFEEKLNAKVIIEENKGHFLAEDGITEVPEVLNEVLECA